MWAASSGNPEITRVLIKAGANRFANDPQFSFISFLDFQSDGGETALMLSALHDELEAVRALLQAGANTNYQNEHGWTALMLGNDEIKNLISESPRA